MVAVVATIPEEAWGWDVGKDNRGVEEAEAEMFGEKELGEDSV